ncbi:MAG: FAD-linked oxidoreductase [Alphaproteobacteria bacterium]|jgi:FAD/FMN-containing dehydrogenase|nr:FAD-linked oxidoreductase [Alphaproteobacteria bacterium]
MASWSNWAGNVECRPARLAEPRDLDELKRLVAGSNDVRVAGSGHSFTPIVATDGLLLSLGNFAGIVDIDRAGLRAEIGAGARLADIGAELQAAGLALANQGDVDVQRIAGAISTGTHGTGRTLGSISTMVAALKLVTASGEAIEVSGSDLKAAALSLGTLGVIVSVTLNLLPAYRLRERVWREPVEQALERLPELASENRHFEFFWLPETDEADCKALHPSLDETITTVEPGERIDWSWRIFPSVRERKFIESEWSVPAEQGPECFLAIRELMRGRHAEMKWPVEYRTVAADDLPLSPAFGRDTVAISIHQGVGKPWEDFFRDAQEIFRRFNGRPHWGKWHALQARDFAALYPQWDRFVATRRRFDPQNKFLSPYLRSLFEAR